MTDNPTLKPNLSRRAQILSFIMIIIIGVISNYIYCLAVYVDRLHGAHGWSMDPDSYNLFTVNVLRTSGISCRRHAYKHSLE